MFARVAAPTAHGSRRPPPAVPAVRRHSCCTAAEPPPLRASWRLPRGAAAVAGARHPLPGRRQPRLRRPPCPWSRASRPAGSSRRRPPSRARSTSTLAWPLPRAPPPPRRATRELLVPSGSRPSAAGCRSEEEECSTLPDATHPRRSRRAFSRRCDAAGEWSLAIAWPAAYPMRWDACWPATTRSCRPPRSPRCRHSPSWSSTVRRGRPQPRRWRCRQAFAAPIAKGGALSRLAARFF